MNCKSSALVWNPEREDVANQVPCGQIQAMRPVITEGNKIYWIALAEYTFTRNIKRPVFVVRSTAEAEGNKLQRSA